VSAARFVDGGAFDGDTALAWLDAGIPLERYWGFEPDPANFAALERWWGARGAGDPAHTLVRSARATARCASTRARARRAA
jgi:hypothetical protein